MKTNALARRAKMMFSRLDYFAQFGGGMVLRPYQVAPLETIVRSIRGGYGWTIVIIFPRQSGKDEFLTQLSMWLMSLYAHRDVGIVIANPTYKPQTINAIMRLENRLDTNVLTRKRWKKRSDYIRRIGQAKTYFLSGDAQANVVGATASLALIVNEAQDIGQLKYDKDFSPMAASTNATRIVCGTVWTSDTLLARELRAAKRAQEEDGIRRVFVYDAGDVGAVHPPYEKFVNGEIARLGRQHPLIRTQYFNEEIDAQVGMFSAGRRALMVGDRPGQDEPEAGRLYAFLVDVAGQDEAMLDLEGMGNPGRDSTTLDVVEIDLSTLELLQAPTYRVVKRTSWIGVSHLTIFGALKSLADAWGPQHIVIDATGVGEGLWSMLDHAYPTRVTPVKFTQQMKSEIGWKFLAVIETGRFRDCAPIDEVRVQYDHAQSEILPGPAKTLRWGVKDGTRDTSTGSLVHDDFILADSLVAVLDGMEWKASIEPGVSEPISPLPEMSRIKPVIKNEILRKMSRIR